MITGFIKDVYQKTKMKTSDHQYLSIYDILSGLSGLGDIKSDHVPLVSGAIG